MANKPSHRVLAVTPRENRKDVLTRIGAAWPIKGGFSLQLDALPVSGRLLLLAEEETTDREAGSEG